MKDSASKKPFLFSLFLALMGILYLFQRQLIAIFFGLPAPRYKTRVRYGIPISMPDGVVLRADHHQPTEPGSYPTILIRTPYGRSLERGSFALNFWLYARCLAERGYHVIIQGVRGRYDSGGDFEPFVYEASDGQATVDWLAEQPWFNGSLGLWGPSYLGYVQWAIAVQQSPYLKAITPCVTFSNPFDVLYPNQSIALDTIFRQLFIFAYTGKPGKQLWHSILPFLPPRQTNTLHKAFNNLPLLEADTLVQGEIDPVYRINLAERLQADHPYWQEINYQPLLPQVKAPAYFLTGWYDLFLPNSLQDYALVKSGEQTPYLTIGPWYHLHPGRVRETLRGSFHWLHAQLQEDTRYLPPKPVQIYVMGSNEWRYLDSWPPPSQNATYFLQTRQHLSTQPAPAASPSDYYVYDPADPTPAVGGPLLHPPCGACDNRALEARPDVLTYTTNPLSNNLEIIGAVSVTLYIRSSATHTDFFARLCDVHPDGRSMNICDSLYRIIPTEISPIADGIYRLEIDLWPTAYHFKRGHAIRLQVSSGAHPRWNRNLGTDEPIATTTRWVMAQQTVYHSEAYPSALHLPVVG